MNTQRISEMSGKVINNTLEAVKDHPAIYSFTELGGELVYTSCRARAEGDQRQNSRAVARRIHDPAYRPD